MFFNISTHHSLLLTIQTYSILILFPRLFLGKHDDAIDKVGDPLLGEAKTTVVFTHRNNGLEHICLFKVVLVKDIVDGLLCHRIERLLHEPRQTEFELHEIAREHHDILCETLELQKISLCILHFLATTVQTLPKT